MRGSNEMDKKIHIIWENSSFARHRINTLKKNGMKNILVLDCKQISIVKERNDVIYFSIKLASILKREEPEKVHHLLMYVPPGKYGKRKKDDHPIS